MAKSLKRPKIKIPLSPFEIAIQVLSLSGMATVFLMLFLSWANMPGKIPTHFGASGRPDAWGGKGSLLFVPVLNLGLFALLSVLEKFPHLYNYLCEITEENARFQYHNARMMISCLKAELILVFGFIQWKTVQVALGKAEGLGIGFLPVFLIIVFGTVGFYIYRMIGKKTTSGHCA